MPAHALVDPARSTLVVDRTTVLADGTDSALVVITLVSTDGLPLPGQSIELAVTGSENVISAIAPTGSDGVTTTRIASTSVETKVLSATVTGDEPVVLADMPAVEFTTGPPAKLVFATQPTSVVAGEPLGSVDVRLEDAAGHVLTNVFDTVTLELDTTPNHATLEGTIAASLIAGTATFTNLVVNRPGQGLRIKGKTSSMVTGLSDAFVVVPGIPSAGSSLAIAPPQAVADGGHALGVVVTIRNQFGAPIPGMSVALQPSGIGNRIIASDSATDRFGRVTATWTSTVAEPKTITATAGAVVLSGNATFSAPTCAMAFPGPSIQVNADDDDANIIADIDGDGLQDFVLLRFNQFATMRGRGDGTFEEPVTYAGPPDYFTHAIAAADVDDDGDLDLLIGAPLRLMLYKNDGTGAFTSSAPIAVGTPSAVGVADFDGDHLLDIAVRTHRVATLRGHGDGTFDAAIDYNVGTDSASFYPQIATTDLDGDGNLDLVTTALTNQLVVMLGNGNGQFQTPVTVAVPYSDGDLAIGDYDGDSAIDVISPNAGLGGLRFLKGNGNGTFMPPVQLGGPTGTRARAVDFDGDGNLDVIMATGRYSETSIAILLGNGNGTFAPERRFAAAYPTDHLTGLHVVDLNGDARNDIVTSFDFTSLPAHHIETLLGSADLVLGPEIIDPGARVEAFVGDFDENGTLDLVAEDSQTLELGVLLRAANGTLAAAPRVPGGNGRVGAVADLDNDGHLDLVTFDGSVVRGLRGNGDGTLRAPVLSSVGAGATTMTTGDFDADGNLDLALGSSTAKSITIALGTGTGTFVPGSSYSGVDPVHAATGDLDGDNDVDLVVASYGAVSVFLGDGTGTFIAGPAYGVPTHRHVAIADVNNDGDLDLLLASDYELSLLLGNGDGTFAPVIGLDVGMRMSSVDAAHMDPDGIVDLVGLANNELVVFRGLGGGMFAPPLRYASGLQFSRGVVRDFDADGRVDVLVPDQLGPGFVMLMNRGCPALP